MADDLASRSLGLVVLEGSSLLILNILSLLGNTLVFLSVWRNPRLRTSTNLYIIALAIGDLLSAVFVMPLAQTVLFSGEWIFGETICQIHAFSSLFVIYVSPATMSLTALNRYVRICRSNAIYNKIFSTKRSRAWLLCVWLFVACYIAVPRLANWQGFEFVPGYAQCSIKHFGERAKLIHYCIVITLFLVIPLTATMFCYTKVLKTIRHHNSETVTSLQTRNKETRLSVQEINLSRSLFIVVFTFMVCWVPLWVIVILRRFYIVPCTPRSLELMCMFFLYISNTVNPFIYAGMNSTFRKQFRRIITCKSNSLVNNESSLARNAQRLVEFGHNSSCGRGRRTLAYYSCNDKMETDFPSNGVILGVFKENTNNLQIPIK